MIDNSYTICIFTHTNHGDNMHESIWTTTVQMPRFPSLKQDITTDILIIGGGIAGLLCAHMLHEEGINYVLAEAKTICSGITKNTTAKITAQHGMIYSNLLQKHGIEIAQMYLDSNLEALEEYKQLCKEIPCAFEKCSALVYSNTAANIEQEFDALCTLGYSAGYERNIPLPVPNLGAISFSDQAQFHPLQFAANISKKLHILENTKIQELQGMTAITNYGKIKAKKIIIATHFPILNKHGAFFMKLYQQRSYVLALENAQKAGGMYIGDKENSLSFRDCGDLLLLGGGGHRTGKHGGNWAELKNFTQKHYPGAKVRAQWATQDCITLDGMPYIGQYAKSTPNLYVITGFNKWGMTSAMAGAMLLRDQICGIRNPYTELYSPSRSIWQKQLFINGIEAGANLLKPTTKRCPHLGCALKWNPEEHSWDCPCHGSRFTKEGKLIDNPATDDCKNL